MSDRTQMAAVKHLAESTLRAGTLSPAFRSRVNRTMAVAHESLHWGDFSPKQDNAIQLAAQHAEGSIHAGDNPANDIVASPNDLIQQVSPDNPSGIDLGGLTMKINTHGGSMAGYNDTPTSYIRGHGQGYDNPSFHASSSGSAPSPSVPSLPRISSLASRGRDTMYNYKKYQNPITGDTRLSNLI